MKKKKDLISYLKKEIKRLKKEIEEMEKVVDYDHMVHFILNRRGLDSRLLPVVHEMHKNENTNRKSNFYSVKEIACVFIDIDRFKKINDTLGHNIGDKTIMLLGKILKNKFRETDLICRYGGDEFVIMIFNSNKKYTVSKMKNVALIFQKEALKLAPKINPTISYGISYLSEGIKDVPNLIKSAGQRMKTDKSAKKLWRIWRA